MKKILIILVLFVSIKSNLLTFNWSDYTRGVDGLPSAQL